jgi:hypothetical protein
MHDIPSDNKFTACIVPKRLLQLGRYSQGKSLDLINLPNPSCRTIVLGLTQPLTEMITRNPPVG